MKCFGLFCNCINIIVLSTADIKKLYRLTGVDNKPTVFLFNDTQIMDESFLEDINNILSSGEVPNLYKSDEFEEVCLLLIKLKCVSVRADMFIDSIVISLLCRSRVLFLSLQGRTMCQRLQTPFLTT